MLAYEAPANTLRLIGTVPAVYLCIGVGLWHAFDALARWLRGRAGGGKVLWPYYVATAVALIMIVGRGIEHLPNLHRSVGRAPGDLRSLPRRVDRSDAPDQRLAGRIGRCVRDPAGESVHR